MIKKDDKTPLEVIKPFNDFDLGDDLISEDDLIDTI